MQMADEVPVQMADEVRRVPVQIADKVPEGSGFRGRKLRLMRFRQVPGQMADEVPESSGQIAKNSPRSSKLLGITHEFIVNVHCCHKYMQQILHSSWHGAQVACALNPWPSFSAAYSLERREIRKLSVQGPSNSEINLT